MGFNLIRKDTELIFSYETKEDLKNLINAFPFAIHDVDKRDKIIVISFGYGW